MDPTPPPSLDPAFLRMRDSYHHLVDTLRAALPQPTPATPDGIARRDQAAIAQVASLCPATAAEATLAAQYVAAHAHALHSLDASNLADPATPLPLRHQATSGRMMRAAQGALRTLHHMQTGRQKRQADNAAATCDAFTEHCALQLMNEVLTGMPQPIQAPPPVEPEPPPIVQPDPLDLPRTEPLAAAEEYAVLYPRRAALIRRLGRVPEDVSFGPPDDDLVRALVTGRSPVLQALEQHAT